MLIMKDQGLNKSMVQSFETSNKRTKHAFFGFRKMFWNYLKKLNVAFFDPCCEDASESDRLPVAFDESQGQIVYFNGTEWVAVTAFTTTTTTTTTSTTTTTTAAPATTTTTSTTTTTTTP